ncbi:MAG: hypothetical protein BMS9Abin13_041 [Patescibacteria group bacterium]|nr:MAG: hypothetical protein BMS9Abin13_041 [Patescibacteria group bacterium]
MKINPSWEYKESPNKRTGRKKPCTVLVMHYTAGGNTDQVVRYFQQPNVEVSAHFVVGRDGKIIQMVKLDDIAYHAGNSVWKEEKWVNFFSVGIEISNWGPLKKKGDVYYCWPNNYNTIFNGQDVFEDSLGNFWESYPLKQIDAVIELSKFILESFPEITLENVVGHEHISPGRKKDPGPAFPWDKIKKQKIGKQKKEKGSGTFFRSPSFAPEPLT